MIDTTNINNLCIDCVLKRGTGDIIEEHDTALLVRDTISGVHFLACVDNDLAVRIMDRNIERCGDFIVVLDQHTGRMIFDRYGFKGNLECYTMAYYGATPAPDTRISIRTADRSDIPMIMENYNLIGQEEMEEVVDRQNLFIGYEGDRPAGFIGEHLEGSIGMLYVFPELRHKGYAIALENFMIARMMKQGYVPFGQVVKDNRESLMLQKKIGMTRSDKLSCWMWKG